MAALVEFSITPIGMGESVSTWVSRAVDVIDRSGLKYQVGPMSTCIEGEWEQVCTVIGECLRAVARECNRVSMSIRVDYRKGAAGPMEEKVRSVSKKLSRPINTTLARV